MRTRREFLGAAAATPFLRAANEKPNVLWILGDDLGPWLSCYGHKVAKTPNIDRIANEGVRFNHMFTTAPVCSAARSAWNTGVYQTTTGTHNHRSHRNDGYRLPEGVRLVSHRFRDAGYFTANVREIAPGVAGSGKTDFNFSSEKPFDGTHWNQRKPGQPFYAQINFTAPHKGAAFVEARTQTNLQDPAKVELPPYYPDHPVVRDEIANYIDAIHLLDAKVGAVLNALERDKVLDNTVIMFFGDNGRCLLRGKQWLYDAGTHVPMLIRWPGVLPKGKVRDDLAVAVDIPATSLACAGMAIPSNFHGRSLLGEGPKRDHVFTARDRCDMTVDRIRAVRDHRYKYIRNFMPERPYTQFNQYITTSYPTQGVLKELHGQGKLNATQSLFMAPRKPPVEFYDLRQDPHEVRNLAEAPEQKARVSRFGALLDKWIVESDDKGRIPEPPEVIEREEPRARKKG